MPDLDVLVKRLLYFSVVEMFLDAFDSELRSCEFKEMISIVFDKQITIRYERLLAMLYGLHWKVYMSSERQNTFIGVHKRVLRVRDERSNDIKFMSNQQSYELTDNILIPFRIHPPDSPGHPLEVQSIHHGDKYRWKCSLRK